jgi:hypothetical protein
VRGVKVKMKLSGLTGGIRSDKELSLDEMIWIEEKARKIKNVKRKKKHHLLNIIYRLK